MIPCRDANEERVEVQLSNIKLGQVPTSKKKGFFLKCNPACELNRKRIEQEERNKKLAEALDIKDANISNEIQLKYSDFLIEMAKKNVTFVKKIEAELYSFLKNSELTKHTFPAMNKTRRQTVHELAEIYGLSSQSFDPEPHRNVEVYKTNLKHPRVPKPLLSEAYLKKL